MNTNQNKKGRSAEKPSQIPKKGFIEIGKRTFSHISDDNIQIVSAGIAFYFFLSIFPALIASINIYSLVIEPSQLEQHFKFLENILPTQAFDLISGIIEPTIQKSNTSIGWGLLISILISLWSANKGTAALFQGVNIAYNEKNKRSFIKKTGLTLLFTIGAILLGLVCIIFLIVYPAFIDLLPIPNYLENIIGFGRWIIIAALFVFGLGMLYKTAPNRDDPEYRWITWGAILSTFLWIAGSLLFSWYVKSFGSFDEVYGSFAAVIIFMLWLFLSAFIVLVGAEINSEMEHQTRKDTTVGKDKPLGERDAYHADHLPDEEKN